SRCLVFVVAVLGLAALLPARAAASPSQTVTLSGYLDGADYVYTPSNASVYGTIGWANNQRDLYVSIYPTGSTSERWDDYVIPPAGQPGPGSFTATGGFAMPEPGLVVQHWGGPSQSNFGCDGGEFTITTVDPDSRWGTLFDVFWSQTCVINARSVDVSGE